MKRVRFKDLKFASKEDKENISGTLAVVLDTARLEKMFIKLIKRFLPDVRIEKKVPNRRYQT